MPPTSQKRIAVQVARIEAALEALKKLVTAQEPPVIKTPAKRTGMTPEARERIAEAQRKRWAKQKRAAKKAARVA
jgi:hypothetical protein